MDGTTTTLGKLLPKSITAKRKSRRQKAATEAEASSTMSEVLGDGGAGHEDDNGSLVVFESSPERDSAVPRRPASASSPSTSRPAVISAHASQIGCLTASSPLVQATHLNSQQPESRPSSRTESERLANDAQIPPASPASSVRSRSSPARSLTLESSTASERRLRLPQPRLDIRPPKTPPTAGLPAAPVIVSTPPTPIDRVNVTGDSPPERTSQTPHHGHGSTSPSQSMSTNRRSKSASTTHLPSKLFNTVLAPLTPTAETTEDSPSAPGFFSSVLSAAQNAASTIRNNIPGTAIGIGGNRSRSSLNRMQSSSVSGQPEPEPVSGPRVGDLADYKKESAVRTLGSGDLSLSQLGIAESTMVSSSGTRLSDAVDSRLRSDSAPVESQIRAPETLVEEPSSRPRSLVEVALGDQTPPQADTDAKASLQRTSSLRSAMRPHRKRGSSTTTGSTKTTVGAALAAAHSTVGHHPSASFATPKLTGFAIASKKRNRDFHSLFKSVPDDDYLIEDYSCALQREILVHGRLYVSEGHLCFSSNILGWTTTLVMSFDEIVSVEKRSTALVFKNGLMISTLHAKHIFASFTGRDATYDLIVNIWKLGHPTLRSTLNGVRLDGMGGDKTEKVDCEPSVPDTEAQEGSESDDISDEDEDEFYEEEENEDAADTHMLDLTGADVEPEKPAVRKASGLSVANGSSTDAPKEYQSPAGGAADFPGPTTHSPTDCGDAASHYDKVIGDDVIAAPLGRVYDVIFGPGSVEWMAKWLTGEQKCTELQLEDKKGLSLDNKSRNYSYIKPLNASLGPKQTKCIVMETMENCDLEKAVNVCISSQTPEVPSGNIFTVKTKYCLSWAENNATRLQVNCTTEWSGKSWLKGPIEKGVGDGQAQYFKDLCAALKAAVSSQPRSGALPNGHMRGKKRAKRSKALQAADGEAEGSSGASHAGTKNWGALEPMRGLVKPCAEALRPVLTGNVLYALVVGLLVAMWFGFGSSPSKSLAAYGSETAFSSGRRLAAYEEMWRREESELWSWLEERVGLHRLGTEGAKAGRKAAEPRALDDKLRAERMDERQMEEAIRVTEEKLKVLKEVMGGTSGTGRRR